MGAAGERGRGACGHVSVDDCCALPMSFNRTSAIVRRFNHALSSFPVDPSHGSASDGEGLESPGAAGSGDLGGRGWARTILWTVLVANGVMGIALHARFLLASF